MRYLSIAIAATASAVAQMSWAADMPVKAPRYAPPPPPAVYSWTGFYVGGKTGTAQIWDPTARGGHGAWKDNLFNYSFVGYIGRQANVPDLVVAIQIEEGTPTIARIGQLEMPVMSFELFRRIATDAITTPDLLIDRPTTVPPSFDR